MQFFQKKKRRRLYLTIKFKEFLISKGILLQYSKIGFYLFLKIITLNIFV